jgi:hypothetical protein
MAGVLPAPVKWGREFFMTNSREELIAANIRTQIGYLEGLLKELQDEGNKSGVVMDRIRQIESKVRVIRVSMGNEIHL